MPTSTRGRGSSRRGRARVRSRSPCVVRSGWTGTSSPTSCGMSTTPRPCSTSRGCSARSRISSISASVMSPMSAERVSGPTGAPDDRPHRVPHDRAPNLLNRTDHFPPGPKPFDGSCRRYWTGWIRTRRSRSRRSAGVDSRRAEEAQMPGHGEQVDELRSQVKFLEEEVGLLRRRLTNAPRQVTILEEKLIEMRDQLAKAMGQNQKLADALRSERDKIEALVEEVDKLSQPPASFGIFLRANDDGSLDVVTAGRKMRVMPAPDIEVAKIVPGSQVVLNESLNAVEVLDPDRGPP